MAIRVEPGKRKKNLLFKVSLGEHVITSLKWRLQMQGNRCRDTLSRMINSKEQKEGRRNAGKRGRATGWALEEMMQL